MHVIVDYCSKCGAPTQSIIPVGDHHQRDVCTQCDFVHYHNPKIIVGALPIWESKILLCKRNIEPRFGRWTLPAGFMESYETAPQGAIRETLEETGAHIEIIRLHTLYNVPTANQIYLLFLAMLRDSIFGPTPESSDVRLFDHDEIPWSDLAFDSVSFALRHYLQNPDTRGVHMGNES